MYKLFTDHPLSVGETYEEHRATAHWFAWQLLGASIACFVHGIFPFLYDHSASRTIARLNFWMGKRRRD